jgi:hypothetical protein
MKFEDITASVFFILILTVYLLETLQTIFLSKIAIVFLFPPIYLVWYLSKGAKKVK